MNPAVIQMRLGARVRTLRDERGLTQVDLARVSDMDRSQLAAIETGRRNVTLANLARLAGALGVTLAQLLDGVDG
ncbi:helix-turn-helix domain-containing protein [Adlercreutzia sp. ZJ242]|uniref:helix-turn-helix domain-containing protein n=1 Tax=Adlercreutzia sp. ZJ242 TaxID=2709409 RepID=UPI001F15152A|nr:helix-turn-helix transcriptional regulator [Adlercreutzia sp. ZJ242]